MPSRRVAPHTAQAGGVATWVVHGALQAIADAPRQRESHVGPMADVPLGAPGHALAAA